MAFDVKARGSYVDVSAQKMRLIVDLVRGKPVPQAVNILTFEPSKAAHPLLKLVNSAAANAEKNLGIDPAAMFVYKITADEAPTRKWRRFGARGRFKPVLRRNSHLTVILRQMEGEMAAKAAASAKPAPAKAEKAKPEAAAKPKAKTEAKPKAKAKAKAK